MTEKKQENKFNDFLIMMIVTALVMVALVVILSTASKSPNFTAVFRPSEYREAKEAMKATYENAIAENYTVYIDGKKTTVTDLQSRNVSIEFISDDMICTTDGIAITVDKDNKCIVVESTEYSLFGKRIIVPVAFLLMLFISAMVKKENDIILPNILWL